MENKAKDLKKVSFGIAIMFVVYWIYRFFIGKHLHISDSLKSIISTIVLYVVGLGLFVFITKDVTEDKYKKENLSTKTYLTCFFLQFCALVVFILATGLLVNITKTVPTERDNLSFHMLFSLLVFAPVVEELVFRHFLASKLLKYGQPFYILVSSFCFCIVHGVSLGIPSIIYTFLLGLNWSYLMVKTGNILIPIIFHSLSNLFGGILPQIIMSISDQLFSIYVILAIILAIVGLILFIRNKKDFTFEDKIFSQNNLKQLFTNKGIIFLILATISFMLIKYLIN
jgi:membrane protease YdiL (CAAX protease family)